jgi:iron complex outermembrane receptor protein
MQSCCCAAALTGAWLALSAPSTALASSLAPESEAHAGADLTGLSLEQLMNIEVVSVSKRPQRLEDAAAAVHVITKEDIRRSGAQSLPDLLRTVPGLEVAQASPVEWAISARGFNGIYADKLLVLIDGRSVYSPSFSGVFWDVEPPPLDAIERIEVIRGSGGTLWGANAVNGVINIITRRPAADLGLTLSLDAGDQAKQRVYVGYAANLGERFSHRVFAEGDWSTGPARIVGVDVQPLREGRFGYRADWRADDQNRFTFDAGYNRIQTRLPAGASATDPQPFAAWRKLDSHAAVSWERRFSDTSNLTAQAYYDHFSPTGSGASYTDETYDLELRRHFVAADRHDVVLGVGYRTERFAIPIDSQPSFTNPSVTLQTWNAFAQDEIALSANWRLVAGLKLEHAYAGGLQYEPTLRLLWKRSDTQTVWAALSRAVRTPSLADLYISGQFPPSGQLALPFRLVGDPDARSESLIAYELGYRAALSSRLTLDASAFYNTYDDVSSIRFDAVSGASTPSAIPVLTLRKGNEARARTWGGEIEAKWQVRSNWRLAASYDVLAMRTSTPSPDVLPYIVVTESHSPKQQLRLQSQLDLPAGLELDLAAFRVGRLEHVAVPAYTRVDARLGWRPAERLDLGLVGENLTQEHHLEFLRALGVPAQVHRSFRAYLRAKF